MQEKREIKAQWAKETYKYLEVSKDFVEKWKTVDTEKGEYMTLGSLVLSFGGWEWPDALRAAQCHALKCLKMRGKWLFYDEMANIMHFLKMRKQFTEEMTKRWRMCTKWHNGEPRELAELGNIGSNNFASSSSGDRAALAEANRAQPPKRPQEVPAGEGAPKKAKGVVKKELPADGKNAPKAADGKNIPKVVPLLKEALAAKEKINKAFRTVSLLIQNIPTDNAYKWARTA